MLTLTGRRRRSLVPALSAAAVATLTLTACGSGATTTPSPAAAQAGATAVTAPVATTYDGGVYVLDGKTLTLAKDIPLPGFNRLNPAGDGKHAFVSTATGFRLLDLASATLTDIEVPAAKPGHVVRHHGKTVLFADGTGEVTVLDSGALTRGTQGATIHRTPEAHHGVAVALSGGELVTTLGNAEKRSGIVVLDANRKEIARNESCPGVHGEAAAQGEAVVIGCETGVLIYKSGAITKVDSPTPYGRIGNQAGSDVSPITLGDYKQDKNAELERPTRVSLIDTANPGLRLVDIGTSYTFRSLARGPKGEGLVLGTDGKIHEIDVVGGTVTRTIPVIDRWEEPLEWQQARPAIFVRGGTAYVSDPVNRKLHAVDLASGTITASATLPKSPNELSGTAA